jgi:hypothetical protein
MKYYKLPNGLSYERLGKVIGREAEGTSILSEHSALFFIIFSHNLLRRSFFQFQPGLFGNAAALFACRFVFLYPTTSMVSAIWGVDSCSRLTAFFVQAS